MTDNALIIQEKPMALLPARSEIKEMADRLRVLVKGGDKLDDKELWALAVGQASTGLNAVTGEIWYIPRKGMMVGIAGLTKRMNKLAEDQNFKWFPERRLARPDDYKQYGIPENAALAYICDIRRSDLTEQYTKNVRELKDAGITLTFDQMIEMFGKPPVISGAGWVTMAEIAKYNEKGGMPPDQKAWKRARASAIKQMIDIPTAAGFEGDRINGDMVDSGDWVIEGDTLAIDTPQDDETVKVVAKPIPEPAEVKEVKTKSRAQDIKDTMLKNVKEQPDTTACPRAKFFASLGKHFDNDNERHLFTKYIWSVGSYHELSDPQRNEMCIWAVKATSPKKDVELVMEAIDAETNTVPEQEEAA